MQISNSAYMGVEVLVRLAAYQTDKPCTAQALAEWINRSMTHTETLMSRLRAAGLVRARKGSGGGYHLNKPADMITVAEIFKAFDEPRVLSRRPLNAISLLRRRLGLSSRLKSESQTKSQPTRKRA